MLLITSCAGSPKKTEYIYEVPDVVFPVFPDPDEVEIDENTGIVSMPIEYYIRIAEYKRDVDKIETTLERLRELYKQSEVQK